MKRTPSNRTKRNVRDPNQKEFGIIWLLEEYPFRVRAGDVFRMDGQYCRVIRVNDCSAVFVMQRPVREFKTRFDKPVRFQPPPKITRMSPNAEIEILNRR